MRGITGFSSSLYRTHVKNNVWFFTHLIVTLAVAQATHARKNSNKIWFFTHLIVTLQSEKYNLIDSRKLMEGMKKQLIGLSLVQLREIALSLGMPKFAGGQIAKWLYVRHATDISEMTDLSKANRERLAAEYEIGCRAPIDCRTSKDGTIKYLFPTTDEKFVETVFIPDGDRATLCVSSQVGCKMGCAFCQTGKQGFDGNLTAGDILNQIYALPEREQLTNIVMMGQGEPMDNVENVLAAIEVMTASWGYGWSPKRITVSTVGLRKGLRKFLDGCDCHLAVSLHSPIHEQRLNMMPAEGAMTIEEVVETLREYDFSHQRRLSFEYIVFKGLNDSRMHAKEIVKLLSGLDCRINLIRFHEIPGVDLPSSDEEGMLRLRDYLTAHGFFTTIRASRGQDIEAACGMLAGKRIAK